MAIFDSLTYDKYIANSDYLGLADYIEGFIPEVADENQRIALMNNVSSLRRFGGIANKILQAEIPDEEKDLFMFNAQKSYGAVDAGNTVYKNYNKYKNNIGAKSHWFKPDDMATSVGYLFDNDEAYDEFINNSGIVVGGTQNVTKQYIDGKPMLRVGKTAFQDDALFDTITKGLGDMITPYTQADWANAANIQYLGLRKPFRTIGFNEKGEKISDVEGLDDNQRSALNLLQQADVVFDKYYTQQYDRQVPADLIVSGYMCNAQKQLYDRLTNNQIEPSLYEKYSKAITDFYDNEFKHFSLTSHKYPEVYMTDPNSDSQTLNLLPDEDKGKWTNYIRLAIKEGRASYSAASAGGRVGTVITISDKPISNELNQEEYSKGVQLFIPGLFDKDAREVMNEDDNARLMVELSEHKVFGHDYKLVEGGKLKNFDGDGGAWFEDDNVLQYVTPEDVYATMKRNMLIEGGIQAAKSMLKRDANGNITNAEKILPLVDAYSKNVFSDLNNINTQEDFEKVLEDETAKKDIDNIFILILRELGLDRLGNPLK